MQSLRAGLLLGLLLLGCEAARAADIVAPAPAYPAAAVPAAPQSGRVTIVGENDALAPSPTDRWYTSGLELRYLSAPLNPAAVPSLLNPTPVRQQRFELILGQTIFTPADLRVNPPDPTDRPYAGWLYFGGGLYQESSNHSLDLFELVGGIVGPAALGEQVQNGFHSLLSSLGQSQVRAAGWASQLRNEAGFIASYEHKWRIGAPIGSGLAVDAIPEIGFSAGNIYTYAETGAFLRLGRNLNADYGPARIRPALSGGSWFDPSELDGPFGWYFFVGAQVRAVAQNIFLDGNTFVASPSVKKYPLVGDVSAGLSIFRADVAKVDLVLVWRSKEFVGQSDYERYGGINISFRSP